MKKLNFIIDGFGFSSFHEFKISAFGFMMSTKVLKFAGALGFLTTLFGVEWQFLIAYVVLIIFEWSTGIKASFKKGEKHESRKLGRMALKIFVYLIILAMLNTFRKHTHFPIVFDFEINPFNWLFWTVLLVIVWQLFVSVLENLDVLGYPFAAKAIKIINKKFYKNLDIE
ncbi:MAG: holin [Flavobacteriaceae bacterium]|nr:MAG: holin [Flavobacteriaceae bacterium]